MELQLKIWDPTFLFYGPETHDILSMHQADSTTEFKQTSSRVWWPDRPIDSKPLPSFSLHLPTSRAVALGYGTALQTSRCDIDFEDDMEMIKNYVPSGRVFFNTSYDHFFMGIGGWNDQKLLIDMLIKLNTTCELGQGVQDSLNELLNIQNLIIPFDYFARLPARVWMEFSKLKKLSILHEADLLTDEEEPMSSRESRYKYFVKPRKGTKYRKRGQWIVQQAGRRLKMARMENSAVAWKVPEIEALVHAFQNKGTFEYIKVEEADADEESDDEVEDDEDEDVDKELGAEDEGNGEEGEEGENDLWYTPKKERLASTINPTVIEELKQKWLP